MPEKPANIVATPLTQPGRRGGTLKVGNPGNRGGKGGDTTEGAWFNKQLRQALAEGRAHQFIRDVIEGEPTEVVAVSKNGTPIMGPPRVKDRLVAIENAANRAFGKPTEHIEASGELVIRIVKEGKRRGGA